MFIANLSFFGLPQFYGFGNNKNRIRNQVNGVNNNEKSMIFVQYLSVIKEYKSAQRTKEPLKAIKSVYFYLNMINRKSESI